VCMRTYPPISPLCISSTPYPTSSVSSEDTISSQPFIRTHKPPATPEEVGICSTYPGHYTPHIVFSNLFVPPKHLIVPLAASGVGYGCMDFSSITGSCISGAPCSFALSCSSVDTGIKIGGALYNGADCTGGVYSGPGAAELAATYEGKIPDVPHCQDGVRFSCAAAGGPPASLYSGYRITTFWDTATCIGQPLSYTDVYNGNGATYSCANGQVQRQTSTDLSNKEKITCSEIAGNSYAYGCVTAMASTGSRTFISFQMSQSISGVSASTWNGSQKDANVIALITSLAETLDVDYDAISNVEITSSSSAINVVTGGCCLFMCLQAFFCVCMSVSHVLTSSPPPSSPPSPHAYHVYHSNRSNLHPQNPAWFR